MRPNKSNPESFSPDAIDRPSASHDSKHSIAPDSASPEYRVNPKVQAKLDPYIAAHQKDFTYYTKLIAENPERAARTLMLKDLEMHEEAMRRINRQLPQAKEFYESQTPEVRKRIDDAIAKVNPYHHDQAFVGEVLAEFNRQNYGKFFGKKPAEGQATSAAMTA